MFFDENCKNALFFLKLAIQSLAGSGAGQNVCAQDNPELAGETPALEGTEVPASDEALIQPETSEASPETSPEEEDVSQLWQQFKNVELFYLTTNDAQDILYKNNNVYVKSGPIWIGNIPEYV